MKTLAANLLLWVLCLALGAYYDLRPFHINGAEPFAFIVNLAIYTTLGLMLFLAYKGTAFLHIKSPNINRICRFILAFLHILILYIAYIYFLLYTGKIST